MGAILCTDEVDVPKTMVKQYFKELVDNDFNSRTTEDDHYRGDYGTTHNFRYRGKYKGKSENPIKKNTVRFFNDNNDKFEKYNLDYAEVGQLGYVAVGFELDVMTGIRGEFFCAGQTYKNVTELKKAFNHLHRKENWLNNEVYRTSARSNYAERVGRVRMITKAYKTKPKQLPKKYEHITEFIRVAYGAINPY